MTQVATLMARSACWLPCAESYLEPNGTTTEGLSAQYVVSNQTQLTLRGLNFSNLMSMDVQPLTESSSGLNSTVGFSAPGSNMSGPLIDYEPAATEAPVAVNQTAPLIIFNSTVHLDNCSFAGNTGFDFGGVAILNNSVVLVSSSSFVGLQGRVAGAMLLAASSAALVEASTSFEGNQGTCLAGGVLVNSGSLLAVRDTLFYR